MIDEQKAREIAEYVALRHFSHLPFDLGLKQAASALAEMSPVEIDRVDQEMRRSVPKHQADYNPFWQ